MHLTIIFTLMSTISTKLTPLRKKRCFTHPFPNQKLFILVIVFILIVILVIFVLVVILVVFVLIIVLFVLTVFVIVVIVLIRHR